MVTIPEVVREKEFNLDNVKRIVDGLREVVENTLSANRARGRKSASRGGLANFSEGEFVLVAREEFNAGEKLALRWCGPCRITKAISEYVYQVEDHRNGALEDVHASRLLFYSDSQLDTEAVMSHVLSNETGMLVQLLMRLDETPYVIFFLVRWSGLLASADTSEPLKCIYEDVPQMLINCLRVNPHLAV